MLFLVKKQENKSVKHRNDETVFESRNWGDAVTRLKFENKTEFPMHYIKFIGKGSIFSLKEPTINRNGH